MHFRVNLKMKKQTCCCFTWIVFIKLNFTVASLLIKKTWDGRFFVKIVCTPPRPPPPPPPPFCCCWGEELTVCRQERLGQFADLRGNLTKKRGVVFSS